MHAREDFRAEVGRYGRIHRVEPIKLGEEFILGLGMKLVVTI
ncbi:MAG: hypothetical protein PT977_09495 [Acidobacteriota bacterium]|nr:hypothetical protein [Acidobacteriota bacterium]